MGRTALSTEVIKYIKSKWKTLRKRVTRKVKRQKKPTKKSRVIVRKIKRILLKSMIGFVGLTVLMVGVFGFLPVTITSIMLQTHFADYRADQAFIKIEQDWVSQEVISPFLFKAVVAAEDQQFYQHSGLDFKAISSAISDYREGGNLRGASTISQQVAKNLFLSPSRSLLRKGLEAWFTVWIELLWSKERILEVYVNIAEWGDHVFGIEAASQHYFNISADKLNISQCALLASVLPNPHIYSVNNPSSHVRKRQRWILKQMRNLGYY